MNRNKSKSAVPWAYTNLEEKKPETPKKVENKPIFLQIQLLKPGDTFGLSLLKFSESDNDYENPELSLVSTT